MVYGSKAKIARLTKMSPQRLNDLLVGRSNTSYPQAVRIANVLGGPVGIWCLASSPEAHAANVARRNELAAAFGQDSKAASLEQCQRI